MKEPMKSENWFLYEKICKCCGFNHWSDVCNCSPANKEDAEIREKWIEGQKKFNKDHPCAIFGPDY